MELFKVLRVKFKPQHTLTILSFQYCKIIREQSKNTKEWVGHLGIKANESEYKEKDEILEFKAIYKWHEGE